MSDLFAIDGQLDGNEPRIVSTPGTCGGKPQIAGHRIRVQDIVFWTERAGMTSEESIRGHPGLTPTKIDAALRYYRSHRAEIARDLTKEEGAADALGNDENVVVIRFPGALTVGSDPNSSR